MGYYTTFNLKWAKHGKFADKPNCVHAVPKGAKFCPDCGTPVGFVNMDQQVAEYLKTRADDMYGIDEHGHGSDSAKWYDHEEHMLAMSKSFPSVLFTLNGEGEESGDIWNKYFLNGKMQVSKAVLTFEPFDEAKLKTPAPAAQ